ncbi:hypothetical protein ACP70R_015266 [Stipagrostis hirtigluma subsp. patula]
MGSNRSWMYDERKGTLFTPTWKHGLDAFLDHAFSLPEAVDGKSKCPCAKCDCRHKRKRDEIEMHLCRNGFKLGYERWTSHGEPDIPDPMDHESCPTLDRMDDMLLNAIGAEGVSPGEEPTQAAKELFKLLEEADTPLHGKTTHSRLSRVGRTPHGRLAIADEAISITEKEEIKTRKRNALPHVSAREHRLERENDSLKRDNNRLRGLERVMRVMAAKGGMDYDALLQEAAPDMVTSESEVGFSREHDRVDRDRTKRGSSKSEIGLSREHDTVSQDGIEHDNLDHDGDEEYVNDDEDYGYDGDDYCDNGGDYGLEDDDYYDNGGGYYGHEGDDDYDHY